MKKSILCNEKITLKEAIDIAHKFALRLEKSEELDKLTPFPYETSLPYKKSLIMNAITKILIADNSKIAQFMPRLDSEINLYKKNLIDCCQILIEFIPDIKQYNKMVQTNMDLEKHYKSIK